MPVLSCFDLTGKVALVTGGSQSIGKAIAKALAKSGARLCLMARTPSHLEAACEEIHALGAECIWVAADISNEDQVVAAVKKTAEYYGHIDILVNNAAHGGFFMEPEDMTMDQWREVMAQNIDGMYLVAREVAKVMIPQGGGRMVMVSSIVTKAFGTHNAPGAYETSKGGVEVLIRSLAASWAKHNIAVNGISPGYTLSDIVRKSLKNMPEEAYKKNCALVPLGRYAEPEEMAPMVVALASDAASYMQGSIVIIDGGRTLY